MQFNESEFRQRVDKALQTVRQILHRTRCPVYAADAQHSYSDKFQLANLLVRLALGSIFQGFSALGLSDQDLGTLLEWSKDKSISLRLRSEAKCSFVKETVREQESATRTETTGHVGSLSFGSSSKTVTTIKEYVWKFQGQYQIIAFRGVGSTEADQIAIRGREYEREIITAAKTNPRSDHRIHPNIDVDISWLLQRLNADKSVGFEIKREVESCRTPRRNDDIASALLHINEVSRWCASVRSFFVNEIFTVAKLGLSDSEKRIDTDGINSDGVFVPVAPIFIEESGADEPGQLALKPTDVTALLAEQLRTLNEKISKVGSTLPSTASLITGAEAHVCICAAHLCDVARQLESGVDYIEHMLRQQLYAAVGKEISSADFAGFKKFHNRKLFRDDAQPLPFSFAVRRSPLHSPEGLLSIEESVGGSEGSVFQPVVTHVRGGTAGAPMRLPINAATSIRFRGDRFLHAWLMHSFSGEGVPEVQLAAQARQLSSFVVLIGRIAATDVFEPKYGMIVQNKDDFRVPLKLATLPTAKEFKDAIESLSPEQQEFCRAWRGMQLESTIFAVCVVQIKPLLERVLNLPPESLSKEIKLTQDLTELFIKYQIPADLLTAGTIQQAPAAEADGFEVVGAAAADKVAEVKGHVAAMLELIEGEKKKQLEEAAQTAVYEALDRGEPLLELEEKCDMLVESKVKYKKSKGGGGGSRMAAPSMMKSLASVAAAPKMMMRSVAAASAPPARSAPGTAPTAARTPHAPAAAAPKPKPSAPAEKQPVPGQQQAATPPPESSSGAGEAAVEAASGVDVDYTKLPAELDGRLEALDSSHAVRPTIISARETWTKKWMASLMSKSAEAKSLGEEQLREEKGRAFELLDALTRSGALVVEEASLHVVVGATHTFDKGLVDTVVQDNVNPILQVERSSLIMASSVLGIPAAQLVRGEHEGRVRSQTPGLFLEAQAEEEAEPAEARALSGLQA